MKQVLIKREKAYFDGIPALGIGRIDSKKGRCKLKEYLSRKMKSNSEFLSGMKLEKK